MLLQEQRDVRRNSTFVGLSDQTLAVESYKVLDEALQGYHLHPFNFGTEAPFPEAVDPRCGFRE